VVETGTGKRDNSLLWVITTAGSNRSGICYEVRTFVTRLLDRVFNDDSQFWIVYGHDDGDDWTLEESLIKANPNWGISVRPDVLIPLQAKAMQMPRAVNNFKTKRLNEWGNADTAWMDMRVWDRCADATLDLDAYAGEPCWIGLDLASKTDIAARRLVFPHAQIDGAFAVFGRYYLPEETVHATGNSQYPGWMNSGRLTVTPGNIIDFGWIEADLIDFASRFGIQAVAFDPFQATQLSTRMLAEELPMIEVHPTVLNLSEPMKTLEALVLQEKLIHDGDPVLGWMASNVVVHLDAKDNIYQAAQSGENRGKVLVLENGMKFHEVGVTNKDAQFLELRKFQITDIARLFRMQPHMIADLDRATFSNIEQQSLEFVMHTMTPWAERWEASIEAELLFDGDGLEVEFDFANLMRGDAASRSSYYQSGIQNGWLTRNEARIAENLNPLEGLDEPLRPLNMVEERSAKDLAGGGGQAEPPVQEAEEPKDE